MFGNSPKMWYVATALAGIIIGAAIMSLLRSPTSVMGSNDTAGPIMPDDGSATAQYWDGGLGEQFAKRHQTANIVHRADYASSGWFYLHLVLEAESGDRVTLLMAKSSPWGISYNLAGDKVSVKWTNDHLHLGIKSPDSMAQ